MSWENAKVLIGRYIKGLLDLILGRNKDKA
jgi:hypothetical protein